MLLVCIRSGVTDFADEKEIKRAYKTCALRCHPDKNPDGKAMFKQVAAAYRTLLPPPSRELSEQAGSVHCRMGTSDYCQWCALRRKRKTSVVPKKPGWLQKRWLQKPVQREACSTVTAANVWQLNRPCSVAGNAPGTRLKRGEDHLLERCWRIRGMWHACVYS